MSRAGERQPDALLQSQVGASVKNGRKVTFDIFDADSVTGYVAGWDDTSWFVLEPTPTGVKKRIVNKNCNPLITLHDEPTYGDEDLYEEMERIIRPFRLRVLEDVFGHSRPATRKAG
jgi:hypothetical protein